MEQYILAAMAMVTLMAGVVLTAEEVEEQGGAVVAQFEQSLSDYANAIEELTAKYSTPIG
jgi:hypothetical protein